jgi:hypothetical protein
MKGRPASINTHSCIPLPSCSRSVGFILLRVGAVGQNATLEP